ncbi:MAG: PspA/IM30 family protein [Desulfobacteraceae bacterium]|jgi:phage shock protein A|nr:PspA/IM30 family protein [Desulfobacteraceae bacterium]
MGIMTRMLRLCKADIHGVMDQLEDKELLLKQHLREMAASLDLKARQASALGQRIERLEGRIVAHRRETEKLEPDIDLAVRKEKDDIARMLIRKRRTLVAVAAQLERRVETMAREKESLGETLAAQRLQYETLKTRAETCCRRTGEGSGPDRDPHDPAEWGEAGEAEPEASEIEIELLQRRQALQEGGVR